MSKKVKYDEPIDRLLQDARNVVNTQFDGLCEVCINTPCAVNGVMYFDNCPIMRLMNTVKNFEAFKICS